MSLIFAPFKISQYKLVILIFLLIHKTLAAKELDGEISESRGKEEIIDAMKEEFIDKKIGDEISENKLDSVGNFSSDQIRDSHSFKFERGNGGVEENIDKKEMEEGNNEGRESNKDNRSSIRKESIKEEERRIENEKTTGKEKSERDHHHGQRSNWIDVLFNGGIVDVMVVPLLKPVEENGHNLTLHLASHNFTLILNLHPTKDLLGATYRDLADSSSKGVGSMGLCEYQGQVEGIHDSWAALSLCPVIRGMIVSGSGTVWVEPGPGTDALGQPHRVFTPDLHQHKKKCGTNTKDVHISNTRSNDDELLESHSRYRRSLHSGLAWTNKTTRFVELVIVVDSSFYKHYGVNTTQRCRAIVNIANALFRKMDIVVVLTHIEIWKYSDEIEVEADSDATLTRISNYRKTFLKDNPKIPCDNMQLFTVVDLDGDTIGKATVNGMCSPGDSIGLVQDQKGGVGRVGNTLAHEMGHNLGLRHDDDEDVGDCECPTNKACVMKSTTGPFVSNMEWSTCSKRNLTRNIQSFTFDCLRDEPTLKSTSCGDGVVGIGEECDCGPKVLCNNPCCNPDTCKLTTNATCASGACCDVKTCRPKLESVLCRDARDECDSPEYCLGDSEVCPHDYHIADGTYCDGGHGYCYNGWCGSRELRCRAVWGENAQSASSTCYSKLNTKGDNSGNCGHDYWDPSKYTSCDEADILCGSLHCQSDGGELKNPPRASQSQYRWHNLEFGQIENCHTVVASASLLPTDWLVPNGAACGSGKMCVDQHCVNVPVSLWLVGFWIFVVVSVILVFLLWDHIRFWWEHRGRASLSPHFPPCAACCDACCCPCMTRINYMLASVLPSFCPSCKKSHKPKKTQETVANGTVANGSVPSQQSQSSSPNTGNDWGTTSTSPNDDWGDSGPEVVTFAPNKGKGVCIIENNRENSSALPYNSQFSNINPSEDWPLADKNSLTDSSSDSPQVDKKLLKHSEKIENNWHNQRSEFGNENPESHPDSPKIQPIRRAPAPPSKIPGGEGRVDTNIVPSDNYEVEKAQISTHDPSHQRSAPSMPPRPDFVGPRDYVAPRPQVPPKPNIPSRPVDFPSREEVVVNPGNLVRPEIPPRPEVVPLRPDFILPSRPTPDVPKRP